MTTVSLPPLIDFSCASSSVSSQAMLHQFAESLGNAIDAKDHCTRNHSEEVAVIAQIIALNMGYSPAQTDTVHLAGHLHDIGKIGLPDSVLSKPGPLTPEEWVLVRQHPAAGAEIIRPCIALSVPGGVADITYQHHERQDGSGYPCGLRGKQICPGARILAVADSLSAMLQNRPYRNGLSFEAAIAELAPAKKRYDPGVLDALVQGAQVIRDNLEVLHQIVASHNHGPEFAAPRTPAGNARATG